MSPSELLTRPQPQVTGYKDSLLRNFALALESCTQWLGWAEGLVKEGGFNRVDDPKRVMGDCYVMYKRNIIPLLTPCYIVIYNNILFLICGINKQYYIIKQLYYQSFVESTYFCKIIT